MYYIIKKNRKGVEILLFATNKKGIADKLLKRCPRTAYIVGSQPLTLMYEVFNERTNETLFYTPFLREAIQFTKSSKEMTSTRPLGMQLMNLRPYKRLLW